MAKKKRRRKNPWKGGRGAPEFRQRVEELILDGILLDGTRALQAKLNEEFPDYLRRRGCPRGITLQSIRQKLDSLIWQQDRLALLRAHVSHDVGLEDLYETLSYIPRELIDKKAKELKGHSVDWNVDTEFEAGVGRIATSNEIARVKPLRLKPYTRENPFNLNLNAADALVWVVSGAHMGLEYNRVFNENALRNILLRAEEAGVQRLILPGGLFHLEVARAAGYLKTLRALYSGLDFEPEVIDVDWREEHSRIRETSPPNEVSFQTVRERMLNALGGYQKVFTDSDGNPIFSGEVLYGFGREEEELIARAAQAHVRYLTDRQRDKVVAEKKVLERQLAYLLKKSGRTEEADALKARVARLRRLENRMRQTNVDDIDQSRFVEANQALLISWIQDAIPSCTFVGQGDVALQLGDRSVSIVQPSSTRSSDTMFDRIMKSRNASTLSGPLPDLVLVAGAYNDRARMGVVEDFRDGKSATTEVWMLPVAVDRDYVRRARHDAVREPSPMAKLIGDPNFEPGAFEIRLVSGVLQCTELPMDMFTQPRSQTRRSAAIRSEEPYVFIASQGDEHMGHPDKRWFIDSATGRYISIEHAFAEIFQRNFLDKGELPPIHMWHSGGDDVQGAHFDNFKHPSRKVRLYSELREETTEARQIIREHPRSATKLREVLRRLAERFDEQMQVRGTLYPEHQVEEFLDLSVDPYVDFFTSVLQRAREAGLAIRGTGDRRDLGVLTWLAGNHFENSVDGMMTEGVFYARHLRNLILRKTDEFTEEEMKQLVRAPLHGKVPIGYGVVSVPGGAEWGLHLRHDPPRKGPQNGWTLKGVAKAMRDRGDYADLFAGLPVLVIVHDIHRTTADFAPRMTVASTPSCTRSDSYGEDGGMSRGNAGVTVFGLPANGPSAGPVRIINFSHTWLKEYFANPWPIDWKRVFRGAV